ncbi:hypothetical protein CVT24_005172 [Panaeolus cyanescens]|uniref:F-box domain-containing protein n=1 Tax=Panaeolus cyanescens TaxID=181874 RepID=A0A409Y905_9AGAR|nr:hypothetical protein CVT24_005172 [Panaeolus cyanescens]
MPVPDINRETESLPVGNDLPLDCVIPISRIPFEILKEVFLLVADNTWGEEPYSERSWIRVTHVCRYWRTVAVDTAQLWCRIGSFSSDWIDVQLERSKRALLYVRIPHQLTRKERQRALKVLAQPHRLQSLSVYLHSGQRKHGAPPQPSPLIKSLLNVAAPSLTTLLIGSEDLPDPMCTLPSALLDGGTPLLRKLEIRDWDPQWSSPLFVGLTSLKISVRRRPQPFPLNTFLAALEKMPNLVEFEMKCISNAVTRPTTRLVQLAHLKSLVLRTSFEECVSILSHIALPQTAYLELYLYFDYLPIHQPDALFRRLGESIERSFLSDPLSNPTLTFSNPRPISPSPLPHHLELTSLFISHETYQAKLGASWQNGSRAFMISLIARGSIEHLILKPFMITTLPFTSIRNVTLSGVVCRDTHKCLGSLPSIEKIHVLGEALGSFVTYAFNNMGKDVSGGRNSRENPTQRPIGHNALSPNRSLCFPQLVFLDISNVRFSVEGNLSPWTNLLDFLRFRRHVLGPPIRRIWFSGCPDLTGQDIEDLKELVHIVQWD